MHPTESNATIEYYELVLMFFQEDNACINVVYGGIAMLENSTRSLLE